MFFFKAPTTLLAYQIWISMDVGEFRQHLIQHPTQRFTQQLLYQHVPQHEVPLYNLLSCQHFPQVFCQQSCQHPGQANFRLLCPLCNLQSYQQEHQPRIPLDGQLKFLQLDLQCSQLGCRLLFHQLCPPVDQVYCQQVCPQFNPYRCRRLFRQLHQQSCRQSNQQ